MLTRWAMGLVVAARVHLSKLLGVFLKTFGVGIQALAAAITSDSLMETNAMVFSRDICSNSDRSSV